VLLLVTELVSSLMDRAPAVAIVRGDGLVFAPQLQQAVADRAGVSVAAGCSYAADGPFAGISGLLLALAGVAERAGMADLMIAHDNALSLLSPSLAERYPVRYPLLTLTVPYLDAVRTFPDEFVTRAVHGAVDFVFALQDRLGRPLLSLGLIDFDQAGPVAGEFLTLLARRAGDRPLLVWVSAPEAPAVLAEVRLPVATLVGVVGSAERGAVAASGPAEAQFGEAIHAALADGGWRAAVPLIMEAATFLLRRGFGRDSLRYAQWAWELVDGKVVGEESWPYLKMLMRTTLGAGDFTRVEALVRQAMELPLRPRARANCYYILSMLHTRFYAQRDMGQAQAYMEECLTVMETDPELDEGARGFYLNAHALILMRLGRLQEAFDLCRDAYERLLARSGHEQFRLQKAILPHNLGRVKAAMGQHAEAVHHFTDALEKDPYYSDLYLERGLSLLRLGRAEEAQRDFGRGLEYGLPSPPLATGFGNACIALGRPAEAVPAFTRALELDEDQVQAYKGRALCLYDLGSHQEALADYDRYLSRQPADQEALVNRASLRHDLGDRDGALNDLAEVLRLNPENAAALANQAVILADGQRWDEALAALDKAIALEPENDLLLRNRELLVQAAAGESA
jgi:tetratricopeptide (TPR) repeat protein